MPTANTLPPRDTNRLIVYVPRNVLPFLAVPVTGMRFAMSCVVCAPAVDVTPSIRAHESVAAIAAKPIRDMRSPLSRLTGGRLPQPRKPEKRGAGELARRDPPRAVRGTVIRC